MILTGADNHSCDNDNNNAITTVGLFTDSIHANACREENRIATGTPGEKNREKRLKVQRSRSSRALKRSRSWHVSAMIYTVRGFRTLLAGCSYVRASERVCFHTTFHANVKNNVCMSNKKSWLCNMCFIKRHKLDDLFALVQWKLLFLDFWKYPRYLRFQVEYFYVREKDHFVLLA